MPRLVFSTRAHADLNEIARYIMKESGDSSVAFRFTDRLIEKCGQLAEINGTIGQARPELRAGLRSFPFGNYVIFFRYHEDSFEVVTVIRGSREVDAFFDDECFEDGI